MNRREFLAQIAAAAAIRPQAGGDETRRRFALTMDDPNTISTPRLRPPERNAAILDTLERSEKRAALFVCGMRVDSGDGRRLLEAWDGRGHILANHSYSHYYLHADDVSAEDFIRDIERGETVLKDYARFRRFFRFPQLKEGKTRDERDAVRRFLSESRYRMGYVTIDTSDWYIDQRMRARLEQDPGADVAPYRDFYLEHMWERTRYYDDLAQSVTKRVIPHALLMHHNLLNALFLGDLLSMFQERQWELIDADTVYDDDIYESLPDIAPAGESLVWALAKESGAFEELLRYPGEDGVYEKEEMDRRNL